MNMAKLLKEIGKIEDYDDLMTVLETATAQWNSLFPDWEIITISVPRNDQEEKRRIIKSALRYIDEEG